MRRRKAIGIALVTAGSVVAGVLFWQFAATNVIAAHEQATVVRALRPQLPTEPAQLPTTDLPAIGQPFGLIHIPAIHVTAPLIQGAGAPELKDGIGHTTWTKGPGQLGNFALAGHRTTYAHPLWSINKLDVGDRITVTTKAGTYTYAVTRHWIVDASAVQVYSSDNLMDGRYLTLTACHPIYSAAKRYVVRAKLVDDDDNTALG